MTASSRRVVFLVTLAIGVSLCAAAIAGAGPEDTYWGPIPVAADSSDTTRATFHDPPMPVHEAIVYWPVRVVTYPLALVAGGIGESIEYLDETKILHRVSTLLAPRRGPFGVVLGIQAGGLAGFGIGVSVEHDAFLGRKGNLIRLRGATTVNGDHRLSLGLRIPQGDAEYFDFGVGYRVRGNARYFGIGPETEPEAESFYRQEMFWSGASLRKRISGDLFVEGDALYSSVGAGEPREGEHPSITTEFAGNLPLGYGYHSYGVTVGAQLIHENGPEFGRPTYGGMRRIRVDRFQGTDKHETYYWSYRAEAQQFFTIFHPYRILAVRGYGTWIDPAAIDDIPFQRLFINDTPDVLRGFRGFRYRDRGMLSFNAEYRFPVWTNRTADGAGIDFYPLADYGQVFDSAQRIGFSTMQFNYGIGIRIQGAHGFIGRLEWARSDEENTFRLRGDQIFQFLRQGFMHGRDPIPTR
jgi:hypothetical protein